MGHDTPRLRVNKLQDYFVQYIPFRSHCIIRAPIVYTIDKKKHLASNLHENQFEYPRKNVFEYAIIWALIRYYLRI